MRARWQNRPGSRSVHSRPPHYHSRDSNSYHPYVPASCVVRSARLLLARSSDIALSHIPLLKVTGFRSFLFQANTSFAACHGQMVGNVTSSSTRQCVRTPVVSAPGGAAEYSVKHAQHGVENCKSSHRLNLHPTFPRKSWGRCSRHREARLWYHQLRGAVMLYQRFVFLSTRMVFLFLFVLASGTHSRPCACQASILPINHILALLEFIIIIDHCCYRDRISLLSSGWSHT